MLEGWCTSRSHCRALRLVHVPCTSRRLPLRSQRVPTLRLVGRVHSFLEMRRKGFVLLGGLGFPVASHHDSPVRVLQPPCVRGGSQAAIRRWGWSVWHRISHAAASSAGFPATLAASRSAMVVKPNRSRTCLDACAVVCAACGACSKGRAASRAEVDRAHGRAAGHRAPLVDDADACLPSLPRWVVGRQKAGCPRMASIVSHPVRPVHAAAASQTARDPVRGFHREAMSPAASIACMA